jgi:hypothetical protein
VHTVLPWHGWHVPEHRRRVLERPRGWLVSDWRAAVRVPHVYGRQHWRVSLLQRNVHNVRAWHGSLPGGVLPVLRGHARAVERDVPAVLRRHGGPVSARAQQRVHGLRRWHVRVPRWHARVCHQQLDERGWHVSHGVRRVYRLRGRRPR